MIFLARTLENSHICEKREKDRRTTPAPGKKMRTPNRIKRRTPNVVNQNTVNCKVEENRSETSISSIPTAFANDMELGDVTNILPGGL